MKVKKSAVVKTEWALLICAVSGDTIASYLFAADFISPPLVCNGDRKKRNMETVVISVPVLSPT